jgi:hypothetical protein
LLDDCGAKGVPHLGYAAGANKIDAIAERSLSPPSQANPARVRRFRRGLFLAVHLLIDERQGDVADRARLRAREPADPLLSENELLRQRRTLTRLRLAHVLKFGFRCFSKHNSSPAAPCCWRKPLRRALPFPVQWPRNPDRETRNRKAPENRGGFSISGYLPSAIARACFSFMPWRLSLS